MHHQSLSDKEIISGFRRGNAQVIREYFYGYCQVGYNLYNQKYQLSTKQNLDFMSLSHQYALYLIAHDWKPLEDHSPGISLRTWLIGGFRYVVLDALKWYKKEFGRISLYDYLLSFDSSNDLKRQFQDMIRDMYENAKLSPANKSILELRFIEGYKNNETAAMLGISPSAVSQRYNLLLESTIKPYFMKYFGVDLDMTETIPMPEERERYMAEECKRSAPGERRRSVVEVDGLSVRNRLRNIFGSLFDNKKDMEKKRTTPEFITELQPGEIFVFGSNLRGMHLSGAANIAHYKFGAVMGQGVGLQGQSYAIPTMQGGVETIRPYVDEFIGFARQHLELTFLVTRIGCGIAGFTDDEISPLFKEAHSIENIVLPEGW